MPEEVTWEGFFNAPCILGMLVAPNHSSVSVAEFGSGYGTFTLPLARLTAGRVHAFDIESELIERLSVAATKAGLDNVVPTLRDFLTDGTELRDQSIDHAMLYNILHIKNPISLLDEAYRIVRPGGSVSVVHWRSDIPTPRGPSLAIRPSPVQIHTWLSKTGFSEIHDVELVCSPYHFGIRALRTSDRSEQMRNGEQDGAGQPPTRREFK